jgi:1-acyl-sn-glycerol-3-phosphate acyltransferase
MQFFCRIEKIMRIMQFFCRIEKIMRIVQFFCRIEKIMRIMQFFVFFVYFRLRLRVQRTQPSAISAAASDAAAAT